MEIPHQPCSKEHANAPIKSTCHLRYDVIRIFPRTVHTFIMKFDF